MKRLSWLLMMFALMSLPVLAQSPGTGAIEDFCNQGGHHATTSGLNASNFQQQVIPHCTVTVYLTGTQTKATIYADSLSTPLANPFTADANGTPFPGKWIFFAAVNQGYDIVMSGGDPPNTYSTPFTLTDVFPSTQFVSPSGGGCSSGGIPTTGGIVTGDNTSTNCGYNNRTNDAAGSPADTQTFGYQNAANNASTFSVYVGNSNGADVSGVDIVSIGDTTLGNLTGALDSAIVVGNTTGSDISGGGSNLVFLGIGAGQWLNAPGDVIAIGNGAASGQSSLIGQLDNSVFLGDGAGGHASGDNIIGIGNGGAAEFLPGASNIVGIGNGAAAGPISSSTFLPTSSPVDVVGIGEGAGGNNAANEVIAIGHAALNPATSNTGTENIALGDHALTANTTGTDNVVIGRNAGANGWVNRFSVGNSNLTGSNNTWVGDFSGPNTTTQLSNTIALGYQAFNTASNQTVIGNSSTTSLKLFGCPTGQAALNDGSGTCYTPGSGSGTITGSGTTGKVPLWTGTTALGNSALSDNGTTVTSTEPVSVNATGQPSQVTLTYNAGHAPTGTVGSAVIAPDTSGNATVSENNAAFSRICTVLNALCSGGGSSPLTTKGDLYGFNTANARIPVGTDGQVLTADSTQALGVKWAAGGGGAQFIDQLTGNNQVIPTGTAQSGITGIANSTIAQNHFFYTDGTDGWWAGLAYSSLGQFVADNMLAMLFDPAYFTAAQRLNFFNKLIGAKNANGDFPIAIAANGTSASSSFCSAWDAHCNPTGSAGHVTGDGWIAAPVILWQYYQQTGDLTPYTANVAAIKTALSRVPKDATDHTISVTAGDEFVPCYGFQEQPRFNSKNSCASVWYAFGQYVLWKMAAAAGDSTNATAFQTEYNLVGPAIVTDFLDGSTGLLKAASSGQNAQDDVMTTVFATWLPTQATGFSVLSSGQISTISSYLATNNSSFTNSGFVRQPAATWGTVGMIPAGGGPPYNSSPYTGDQYQGGFWGFPVGPYVYALSKTSSGQALIPALLTSYRDSINPGTEWRNVGSTAAQGTVTLLTSPMGPKWAQDNYPSALALTDTLPCLNSYGVMSGDSTITCSTTRLVTVTGAFATGVPLTVNVTGSGSGFTSPLTSFAPGITAGGEVSAEVGKDFSNYDTAYFGLKFAGTNSTNNAGCVGMFNADNSLCWFPNSTVAVGTTTPQTAKFSVLGGTVSPTASLTSTATGGGANTLALINSTITASNFAMSAPESSLGTGNSVGLLFGHDASTNNEGYVRFTYAGSGSASNFVSLGGFAADDLFRVYMDGHATLAGNATSGSANLLNLANSTVTASNFAIGVPESSLGTGNSVGTIMGHDAATNNEGYWRFTYSGAGSAQNFVSLGLFGADDLLQVAANGTMKLKTTFTVSTLPSASTVGAGSMAIVTDATTFTVGTCTGGGSDTMIAVSNGTSWSCH